MRSNLGACFPALYALGVGSFHPQASPNILAQLRTLKFKEETNKVLHSEHSFVWC
jgi:hypothetical protein